jgi:hypothetical protein
MIISILIAIGLFLIGGKTFNLFNRVKAPAYTENNTPVVTKKRPEETDIPVE